MLTVSPISQSLTVLPIMPGGVKAKSRERETGQARRNRGSGTSGDRSTLNLIFFNSCHTWLACKKLEIGGSVASGGNVVVSARWKKIFWLFLVAAAPTVLSLGFSRVEPAGKAMAENARAGKGGQGACCCAGLHGDCCSSGDGNCACGKQGAVLNRFQLLEPLAFSQTSQDTEKPAPQEKKVTPEAKTLGGEIRKALLNHQKALAD